MKTTITFIAAILLVADLAQTAGAATGNAYADAVLLDNPLVFYRLDETSGTAATDSSPNSRNGTYANVGLGSNSLNAVLNMAGRFNNNNSSVAVPALGSFGQVTLELWARPNSFQTFDTLYNMDGWSAGWIHYHFVNANQLEFSVNGNSPTDFYIGGPADFPGGQWRHVVTTYDSTAREMKVYVNGQLLATRTYTTAVTANLAAAHIGAWNGNSRAYDGLIDEFAVYDAVLPADRIVTHYAVGSGSSIVITNQPAGATVLAGDTVTFTVGAVSYVGAMSYQWQSNGVDVAGATEPSFTSPPLTALANGASFHCVVSAGGTSVTSQDATVTVFAREPIPDPVASLTFESTLADQSTSPNRHDGTLVGGGTYSADVVNASAGTNSFIFPGASRVELVNSGDLNMNTGTPFTISAWIKTAFSSGNRVIFGKSPSAFSSATHTPALFVNGNGNLVYDLYYVGAATSVANVRDGNWNHVAMSYDGTTCRFYVNGRPDMTTGLGANEPTASSWVFSIGQSLNTAYPGGDWVGNIDEVAFWGSALSQAQLFNIYREGVPRVTVRITQQPMDATAYTNQTVTFSLTAVSYAGALSYQWQSNGVNLAGATSESYTTPALGLANNGDTYRCVVSASGISVTSREATVYVVEPTAVPGPLMWLNFENTLLDQGGAANRHDGTFLGNAAFDPNTANATAGAYSVYLLAPARVEVANPGDLNVSGSAPFTIAAWILPDPSVSNSVIVAKSPPTANVIAGGSGTHAVALFVTGDGRLAYNVWNVGEVRSSALVRGEEWKHVVVTSDGATCRLYVNGQPDTTSALSGANEGANGEPAWQFTLGQSLNTSFPGGDFTGNIDEVAFWGAALSQAEILGLFNEGVPQVAVTLTQQPADAVVFAGGTTSFTVAATAIGTSLPLQYQWQKNDANIPDATNASYTTPALAGADNGARYRCVVTAGPASATSREAILTVLDTSGPYASAVVADSPLVYYRFEEESGATAYDVSGHGKHGTYANVSHTNDSITALLGRAAGFKSGSVAVPALGILNTVTIELWMKPKSYNEGDANAIYLTDGWDYGWLAYEFMPPAWGQALGTVQIGVNGNNPGDVLFAPFGTGQWQHLVVTYDSTTGTVQRYLNGALAGSQTLATAIPLNLGAGHLASWNGDSRFFDGLMDEFAIYGSVLPPDRILAHYTAGSGSSIVITNQPADATVLAGATVTFVVGAVSYAGAMSYQWQSNGVDIAGATSASYTTPALAVADSGTTFHCLVSAGGSSVASRDALLVVVTRVSIPWPVAWLNFNNTLADQAANPRPHDGTFVGEAAYSASVPDASAGSASAIFDGASDRVELANPEDLNVSGGSAFTITAWIRADFSDGDRVIVGKSPASAIEGPDGTHTAAFFVDGGGFLRYDLFWVGVVVSSANVRNGQWTHVAVSFDGSTYQLFVNGLPDASGGMPGANEGANGEPAWQFTIGQSLNSTFPGGDFQGNIDEVAFWGSALSPEQVFNVFARGFGAVQPELRYVKSGDQLTFSWAGTGFKLQQNGDLSNAAGWSDVPDGGSSPVNVTIGPDNRFFRLIKP